MFMIVSNKSVDDMFREIFIISATRCQANFFQKITFIFKCIDFYFRFQSLQDLLSKK